MKKLLITIAIAIVGASSHAQWIVYDPTVNIEQIISEAENIAEYVDMVDNQVQQITQLSDQLQQLHQYNKAFGDPSQILNVTGVSALTSDLTQTPLGQTISSVEQSANGVAALTYDANGLYNQIGATFITPSTTEALQSATTASEVQKLTGVLVGQNAALAATDKEIDQAVAVSVEQDIENRNDAQKQAVAAQEQQKAEVVEAFSNYRTNFQLNTQPPMFPTGN
jgi:hypothetical protein